MRWEADVPLGPLTRLRVGGATPRLARPGSEAGLREVLEGFAGRPFRVLGGGANTLVSDAGVEEPVLIELERVGTEGFLVIDAARLVRVENE